MRTWYSALLSIFLAFGSTCDAATAWSEGRYPYENSPTELPFKKEVDIFSSDGKLKVHVSTSYPLFQSDSSFIQEVNRYLRDNAKQLFDSIIQEFTEEEQGEEEFDEEAISMDFDKRKISYSLTPTYASSSLVSVFGNLHSYTGMPHASSRYYAFNYWLDGKQIHEATLESLFLSDKNFVDFIVDYCTSTLKTEKVGYTDDLFLEFKPEDLHIFTLSKNGLTITFRPYHVGGWADGPYSITIPFQTLMPYIRPSGPLDEFVK